MFPSILTFFGLGKNHRVELFTELDEIVTYGENYDWGTVYNFPIWLRKFTYKKIVERFKKKNGEGENVITNTTSIDKIAKPPQPQTNNVYTSNVSKK